MNLGLRVLVTLGMFGEDVKLWGRSRGILLEDDHPLQGGIIARAELIEIDSTDY